MNGREDGELKEARFGRLQKITLDHLGDCYVTDRNHVRRINSRKQVVETVAGCYGLVAHRDGEAKNAIFSKPTGITAANDGAIYICDTDNHCIRKLKDGIVSTVAGTPGLEGNRNGPLQDSLFSFPTSLIEDIDGTLLVSSESKLDFTVRRIDLKKNTVSIVYTPSDQAWCIAKDGDKYLYIGYDNYVLKLENTWRWERFLWIGHLKENLSYCDLAKLPKELIKEITAYFVEPKTTQEFFEEMETEEIISAWISC